MDKSGAGHSTSFRRALVSVSDGVHVLEQLRRCHCALLPQMCPKLFCVLNRIVVAVNLAHCEILNLLASFELQNE